MRGGFFEAGLAGDLERHLGRVDVVVLAVDQADLDVDHAVAGEHAGFEAGLHALVDRLDVLTRDATTRDLVVELVALARVRLDRELDDRRTDRIHRTA